jgi:hypothetical protein
VRVASQPEANEIVSVVVIGETAPLTDRLRWTADLLRDYRVQATTD